MKKLSKILAIILMILLLTFYGLIAGRMLSLEEVSARPGTDKCFQNTSASSSWGEAVLKISLLKSDFNKGRRRGDFLLR